MSDNVPHTRGAQVPGEPRKNRPLRRSAAVRRAVVHGVPGRRATSVLFHHPLRECRGRAGGERGGRSRSRTFELGAATGTVCPGSSACTNGAAEPAIRADNTGTFYVSSELRPLVRYAGLEVHRWRACITRRSLRRTKSPRPPGASQPEAATPTSRRSAGKRERRPQRLRGESQPGQCHGEHQPRTAGRLEQERAERHEFRRRPRVDRRDQGDQSLHLVPRHRDLQYRRELQLRRRRQLHAAGSAIDAAHAFPVAGKLDGQPGDRPELPRHLPGVQRHRKRHRGGPFRPTSTRVDRDLRATAVRRSTDNPVYVNRTPRPPTATSSSTRAWIKRARFMSCTTITTLFYSFSTTVGARGPGRSK